MNDLFRSTVSRGDFQRWLDMGTTPITVWQGKKADMVFLKLEKSSSVDYLYKTAIEQGGDLSWNNSLTFCGMYDIEHQTLYLTKDSLRPFMSGKPPLIAETGPSMTEEIKSEINRRVEDIIANDRSNLSIQEVTSWQASHDLEYYCNHFAREDAIKQLFSGQEPDGRFHSRYHLEELPEAAFIAYIADPELFVQTEAEQYIKDYQESFLLQFLKNDALLAEYQALIQNTDSPIHQMKTITDAIKACGAKTVTVTVQKDGQELTFKASADSLMGYRNYYSTYDIPASDRREFARLFGRHADYSTEDIAKITYGRNTIYEAPPVQSEGMGPVMGGM